MPVVLFEIRDHIGYITMNRPESKNAYDQEMQHALHGVWEEVRDNPEIHAAILTGAGEAFSTGADMNTYLNRQAPDVASERSFFSPFPRPHQTHHDDFWSEIVKPLIAAINGPCRSGGLALALSSDVRIASETATFALAHDRAGPTQAGSVIRLIRSLPDSVAFELLFTGRAFSVEEALKWGLVSRVVPRDQVLPAAEEVAHQFLQNPYLAVWESKELYLRGRELPLSEAIRLGRQTEGQRVYSQDAIRWRQEFIEGKHRYTREEVERK